MFKQLLEKENCKITSILRLSNQITNQFDCCFHGISKSAFLSFIEKNKFNGHVREVCLFIDQHDLEFYMVTDSDSNIFKIRLME